MIELVFLGLNNRRAKGTKGDRLLDLRDDASLPVSVSCRSADCGVCRIEVVQGAELLEPPSHDEKAVLARLGSPPKVRLLCQAVLRENEGSVVFQTMETKD